MVVNSNLASRVAPTLAGALTAVTILTSASAAMAWPAEATRELAVREGPGQQYPHIDVIAPGTVVNVHHCNSERTWCKVDTSGTVGYLRGTYLTRVGDIYLGPRVEYYTTYSRRMYVAPPRPYVRYYDGPYYSRPYRW